MDIHVCTEKDTGAWERFVGESNNGTIFHTLKFLSYHPEGRFRDHHLLVREKDSIIALFPAVVHGDGIVSHRGASYGGFVCKKDLGIHKTSLMVEQVADHCRKKGFASVTLTQTPLVYYREPNQYIDFALVKNGFGYVKREVTAVIPLYAGEPLATFHADARRSTKKALREGIEVRLSDDYPRFYEILEHNLGMRHNVSPTHTLAELERLHRMFPDDILLFAAFRKQKMIGGVVIFICNPSVILAFYISHDQDHQLYRPVNVLFYKIITWGRNRGFRYLDLGTFTLNMEPNWGLGRFKENHNARGFLRDTYRRNLT